MAQQTIAVGSDHAGFKLKTRIKSLLNELGFLVLDLGTQDEISVDYPDYAKKVVKAFGILIIFLQIIVSVHLNFT